MKKRFLSLVLCGGLIATQCMAIPTTVNASVLNGSSIESRIKKMNADIVVDSTYTGVEGKRIHGAKTYRSLQNAVDSVNVNNKSEVKIYLTSGTYYEKVTVNKPNIILIGEDVENTILTYDVANGSIIPVEEGGDGTSTYGTEGCGSLMVTSEATGFSAINLTIENSFDEVLHADMKNRQAVALRNDADESIFINCRLIGNQDTLYASSNKQYYYNCYIEGDVDFIFGGATAVFEDCEIFSVDRNTNPKGYITAPSTLAENEFGFVILNSKLTTNITVEGKVYLGRPWHPSYETREVNSNVVYKNCEMGAHIAEVGWTTMKTNSPLDNSMFEYGSYGSGAIENETRRILTDEEALKYTTENVLAGWNVKRDFKKLSLYTKLFD